MQKECIRLQDAMHDAESRANGAQPAVVSNVDATAELRQQIQELHDMNDSLRAQLRTTEMYRSAHAASPSRGTDFAGPSDVVLSMDVDKKLDDSFGDLESGGGGRNARNSRSRSTFVPLVNSVRSLPWPLGSSAVQSAANSVDSVFIFGATRPVLRTFTILAGVLMSIHTFALLVIALSATSGQMPGTEVHADVVLKPPPR